MRQHKAEFDLCSMRVQPFPDGWSPDEIHSICYEFGCQIGPVKAVWNGHGTRSGKPYGTCLAHCGSVHDKLTFQMSFTLAMHAHTY